LIAQALQVADAYAHVPYFSHAQELLLHHCVEHAQELLPTVNNFLMNFDSYERVIVNFARKSEMKHWEWFFGVVGDVRKLFQVCFW